MILTIFTIFLRIASNSFLNVIQKTLSKTLSPLVINFKTYFFLCVFCLPLLILFYLNEINIEIILWAFIGGIFGACGNACLIEALKNGELSILAPINSYKAIVGLLFSVILIGEMPNLASISGILLILFGSYFVFETTQEGFSLALFKRKDVIFRFLALILTAIEAVFIKKVIILSDVYCSFLLWVIFGCLFSFMILKIKKEKINLKVNNNFLILLSFLVLIMQLSTNYVFSKIPVAPALSLFQLSNILNVILGYKIFKEKDILKKIIGAIIMLFGSCVILFNS